MSPSAGWTGAADTTLHQDAPDTNYGGGTELRADGDQPSGSGQDYAALLRWDVSFIPPEAIITEVSTSVNITAEIITATYEVYELRRAWVEGEATWNRATAAGSWETPGALGASDRGTEVLGVLSGQALGQHVFRWTDAGVAVVQAWVSRGSGNFGVIVHDTTHTNGQSFTSREGPAPERPTLIVAFDLRDAGAVDAGAVDAGAVDAGAVDAGAADAGAVDAGAVDAGSVDAGSGSGDGGLRPAAYQVGCGCGPGPAEPLRWALVLAVLRTVRRRKRARPMV